jgi:WD repeat-containing protein 35
LKTAIRLVEYEKELSTRVVYSLVALSAGYSSNFVECSKAFVKLENMEGISPQEKEKYEMIAVSIFSKNSPDSSKKEVIDCPAKNCDGKISDL